MWLAGAVHLLFRIPIAGTPCEVTPAHGESITLIEHDLAARFQFNDVFNELRLESYFGVVLLNNAGVVEHPQQEMLPA